MKKVKYHVPPKLQNKLLLSGLTISEVGIAFVLALIGFFSTNRLNGLFWPGMWLLFTARLFSKRSLFQILKLMLPLVICMNLLSNMMSIQAVW